MLSVAVAKQGAEFTIRVQITPSTPHLALNVQQFAFTAAEMQIAVIHKGRLWSGWNTHPSAETARLAEEIGSTAQT